MFLNWCLLYTKATVLPSQEPQLYLNHQAEDYANVTHANVCCTLQTFTQLDTGVLCTNAEGSLRKEKAAANKMRSPERQRDSSAPATRALVRSASPQGEPLARSRGGGWKGAAMLLNEVNREGRTLPTRASSPPPT